MGGMSRIVRMKKRSKKRVCLPSPRQKQQRGATGTHTAHHDAEQAGTNPQTARPPLVRWHRGYIGRMDDKALASAGIKSNACWALSNIRAIRDAKGG